MICILPYDVVRHMSYVTCIRTPIPILSLYLVGDRVTECHMISDRHPSTEKHVVHDRMIQVPSIL